MKIRITKLIIVPELLFSTYIETLLFIQYKDVFVIQKKWKHSLDNNNVINRNVIANKKLNWKIISNGLFQFNKRIYIFTDSSLKYKLLQTFYNIFAIDY